MNKMDSIFSLGEYVNHDEVKANSKIINDDINHASNQKKNSGNEIHSNRKLSGVNNQVGISKSYMVLPHSDDNK